MSVSRLERSERAAVKRAAFDYLAGPARPGHRLHRLVHADDHGFWSLRVSRDLRIILHRTPDEVVLCIADHHDRAYAWAAQRVGAPGSPDRDRGIDLAPAPAQRCGATPATVVASAPRAAPKGETVPDDASRRSPVATSRRGLRLARRASAPLRSVSGAPAPAAPAPLVHLLRFFEEAQVGASRPAASQTPRRPTGTGRVRAEPAGACLVTAMLASWAVAAALGLAPLAAIALSLLQALCAHAWLRTRARRSARALEVVREGADAEVAALASALEALRRGEVPDLPATTPAGSLARAWNAVERLGRFLALHPEDIRRLASLPVRGGPPP